MNPSFVTYADERFQSNIPVYILTVPYYFESIGFVVEPEYDSATVGWSTEGIDR